MPFSFVKPLAPKLVRVFCLLRVVCRCYLKYFLGLPEGDSGQPDNTVGVILVHCLVLSDSFESLLDEADRVGIYVVLLSPVPTASGYEVCACLRMLHEAEVWLLYGDNVVLLCGCLDCLKLTLAASVDSVL